MSYNPDILSRFAMICQAVQNVTDCGWSAWLPDRRNPFPSSLINLEIYQHTNYTPTTIDSIQVRVYAFATECSIEHLRGPSSTDSSLTDRWRAYYTKLPHGNDKLRELIPAAM